MKQGFGALARATAVAITMLGACAAQAQNTKPFEIVEATIDDIHMAMRAGRLTARQLVQGYLDRINALDKQGPTINSVITLNPNALAEADRLDAALRTSGLVGPLHGIAILVKDEIDTAGMPTTLGTVVFKDYRPPKDAFAIDKLRKAGAIILGKATLSEFAAGDTYGSIFGVTRNPYDLERTVGGSSGGSGAALAANFSTVTIGEETVASIRRPAAWNAVVSLRPTPGLVSRTGMWDGYPTVHAQMGPMARTVRDLAKLLDGMVGYDPEDPVTALGVGKVDGSYTRHLDAGALNGARIGILRESIGNQSDPNAPDFKIVDAAFEKNVAELKAAGATLVDPIAIPNLKKLLATRERNPIETDAALELYLARNPSSPYKNSNRHHQLARHREELSAAERHALQGALAALQPGPLCRIHPRPRRADDQHCQGHGGQQARRHRAQVGRARAEPDQERHQSALRDDAGRSDVEHVPDLCGLDDGAVRVHQQQSPGRHHILRDALQRADTAQARLCLRAGDAPPSAAEDHATVEQVRSGVAAAAVSCGAISNPPAARPI